MLTRLLLAAALAAAPLAPLPAHAAESVEQRLTASFAAARRVTDGSGITVAVVDSGVSGAVPSLRGRLLPGKNLVKDAPKVGMFGTLMASRVVSLAPGVRILPVSAKCGLTLTGKEVECRHRVAEGIVWAAENGAQVIITTLAVRDQPGALVEAVARAQRGGAVIVAPNLRISSATPGAPPPKVYDWRAYPAAFPGVIGVALTRADGTADAISAPTGASLVAAPAHSQRVEGPDGMWTFYGTPPAVASVGAAAALVRAAHPDLSPQQVVRALTTSARHPKHGYDTSVGFGLIDPAKALKAAASPAPSAAPTSTEGANPAEPFGEPLPDLDVVVHSRPLVAGGSAAVVAGAVLVLLPLILRARGRKKRPVQEPEPQEAPV
ncbi:S8 family serine peptidase [Actinocorallia sp. A-T 12471]|uniref:S8 family serine peptidase n=1 Tax=Actinocorallia sp. A-T 12471 TaxID=3089813 RepID=UPI0029D3BACB|nr:S8 family serine peptidase [Actinocorallia sp. A-T 12471]MDX6744017.1 S8 family serine peptidase [Actinocorallia sp. A-T 12471]